MPHGESVVIASGACCPIARRLFFRNRKLAVNLTFAASPLGNDLLRPAKQGAPHSQKLDPSCSSLSREGSNLTFKTMELDEVRLLDRRLAITVDDLTKSCILACFDRNLFPHPSNAGTSS